MVNDETRRRFIPSRIVAELSAARTAYMDADRATDAALMAGSHSGIRAANAVRLAAGRALRAKRAEYEEQRAAARMRLAAGMSAAQSTGHTHGDHSH